MAKFDRSLIPVAPDMTFERHLTNAGAAPVCGIDEAGRGALAGPVAAASVILPSPGDALAALAGVRDSKEMTAPKREYWAARILDVSIAAGVGLATNAEIDRLGIVPATRLAAERALDHLEVRPGHLLLDHLFLPDNGLPQTWLTKGDQRSLSIAAASILAKVARDTHMSRLDKRFPGYGFSQHKGYATAAHRATIAAQGPSPVHRITFAPMRNGLRHTSG